MFSRALIVLLLVLNVGVAAWWALRAAPPAPVPAQAEGVARLQMLREVPVQARPKPRPRAPAAVTMPAADVAATAATQCFSFGPYADAAAAAAARARLQPLVQRIASRTQAAPPRGWRVYLPPLPSPDVARATAQRIAAAGFSDYLVLHEGADANAIALGRYGSEDAARDRVSALVAAGFAARAAPLADGAGTIWLDIAAGGDFDAARARTAASAARREPLDCARLP